MNIVKMKQFGPILTGRDFAKKAMRELSGKLSHPTALDFEETISLGSSFGDEVVPVIAKRQNNEIEVLDVNGAIWACLEQIAKDHKSE